MSRVDTQPQLIGIFKAAATRLDGGALDIRVTDWKDPKTRPQENKFYAIVRDFSLSQGMDVREMKVRLLFRLAFTEFIPTYKGNMEVPKSIASAKLHELSDLIDQLQALAIENGIELREEL